MSIDGLYFEPVSYPINFITLPFVPPALPPYGEQLFKSAIRTLTASGGNPVMTAGQYLQKTIFEFLDINTSLSHIVVTLHLNDAFNYDNVAPFGMVCWDYGSTANRISVTTYNSGAANITNWGINIVAYPLPQIGLWSFGNANSKNTRQSVILGTPILPNPPVIKLDYLAPVGQSFNDNSLVIGETGLLYFAEDNGALICLTDTGATAVPLWTQNTGYANLTCPTIGTNNILYAVGTDTLRAISGINTATPSTMWSVSLQPLVDPLSPLVYYDEAGTPTIYVSGSSGHIYAVSGDGEYKWTYTLPLFVTTLAVSFNGLTIYATANNTLYAITSDGVLKWTRVIGAGLSPPSIGTNGIIYTFAGTYVYAVQDDQTTSTLKWILNTTTIPARTISIGSTGRLFLVSTTQMLCVKDNGNSGSLQWLYNINPALAPAALTAITIGLDGTLYTTGDYALAVCVTDNGSTGFVINWAFQVLLGGYSSPCSIGLNKRIYFGGDHGHIIAL